MEHVFFMVMDGQVFRHDPDRRDPASAPQARIEPRVLDRSRTACSIAIARSPVRAVAAGTAPASASAP
jgi:hypothetical protein